MKAFTSAYHYDKIQVLMKIFTKFGDKMIYFDNAATTIHKPREVIDAVVNALNCLGNAGRGTSAESLNASRVIYETREKLCKLFNAESPKQIAFTYNATMSLNIAIKGLLQPGDHCITTVLEHNSVLRPLYELEKYGVEISFINCDDKGCLGLDELEKFIKPNTKAIICTHASNVTGNIVDIKYIGQIAKKHGVVFIVDAAQTAGIIPIDVIECNIDILCFTGHKSLLAPQGVGGIYVRKGINLKPLVTGGSGFDSFNEAHPELMPSHLEAGTLNSHGIAGLNAGLSYLENVGMDKLREAVQELTWLFYQEIKDIDEIKTYGDFHSKERCPIISFNILDYDSAFISDLLLTNYNIASRPGIHCAPLIHKALGTINQGVVRFSFSYTNTKTEILYATKALKTLLRDIKNCIK